MAVANLNALARLKAIVLVGCVALGVIGCVEERSSAIRPELSSSQGDEEFDAGARRRPTARTLYAMAKILASQGKDAQCEAVLRRLILDHRTFLPAYCDMAELRIRQRRVGGAILVIQAGLRIAPNDAVLANNLGMCRLLEADYAAALALFTKACSVVPQNARYRGNMALALGMLGRYDEAGAMYLQILPPDEVRWNLDAIRQAREKL